MNDKLNLRRSVRPSSLSRDSTMDDLCCYFCHFLCVFSIRLISAISHCKMKNIHSSTKSMRDIFLIVLGFFVSASGLCLECVCKYMFVIPWVVPTKPAKSAKEK